MIPTQPTNRRSHQQAAQQAHLPASEGCRLRAGPAGLTPRPRPHRTPLHTLLPTSRLPHPAQLRNPQLILDSGNYPSLQTLCVERLDFSTHPMSLQLQLPSLHTLSIDGIVTQGLAFANSLGAQQCPNLTSVNLHCISFQPLAHGERRRDVALHQLTRGGFPQAHHPTWLLEMPACESLELSSVDVPAIRLHAPNLRRLSISLCKAGSSKEPFFTLLPDVCPAPSFTPPATRGARGPATRSGTSTADSAAAVAAAAAAAAAETTDDAATAGPAVAAGSATAAAAGSAAAAAAAAAAAGSAAGCSSPTTAAPSGTPSAEGASGAGNGAVPWAPFMAGGRNTRGKLCRLTLVHCSMGWWVGSHNYRALCGDPRTQDVEDIDAAPGVVDFFVDGAELGGGSGTTSDHRWNSTSAGMQ
ncbi:MAG: hypothetical protein WDW36_001639 [Sanguina aurantia]